MLIKESNLVPIECPFPENEKEDVPRASRPCHCTSRKHLYRVRKIQLLAACAPWSTATETRHENVSSRAKLLVFPGLTQNSHYPVTPPARKSHIHSSSAPTSKSNLTKSSLNGNISFEVTLHRQSAQFPNTIEKNPATRTAESLHTHDVRPKPDKPPKPPDPDGSSTEHTGTLCCAPPAALSKGRRR